MNMNPLAALSSFASKVSTILPLGFTDNNKAATLTTYDDISEMSKWMQQEKFLNFAGMLVTVPPGLNVYMIDHVQRLESVWSVLDKMVDDVLDPVTRQLAAFTHDLAVLTLPVGFRFKDFKYPLKNVAPDDLVKKLASSYTSTSVDQRPIEKVFHSANEIDVVFNRAKALQSEVTKKLHRNIEKKIESIKTSVDIIAEANINSTCAGEIIKLVDMASDWVELFGLFMKQNDELVHSLSATGDRLKALKANKK